MIIPLGNEKGFCVVEIEMERSAKISDEGPQARNTCGNDDERCLKSTYSYRSVVADGRQKTMSYTAKMSNLWITSGKEVRRVFEQVLAPRKTGMESP